MSPQRTIRRFDHQHVSQPHVLPPIPPDKESPRFTRSTIFGKTPRENVISGTAIQGELFVRGVQVSPTAGKHWQVGSTEGHGNQKGQ
jgi:hypothetical protein